MNICLDNPYADVTIPRAKLRASTGDDSTVIGNPLAVDGGHYMLHSDRNSALNPYGNFRPSGDDPTAAGVQSQPGTAQNPPAYGNQLGYTVKEEDEEVGRCYTCCRRCRKKK